MVAPLIRRITTLCMVGLVGGTQAGTHNIAGHVVGMGDGDCLTLLDINESQRKMRRP